MSLSVIRKTIQKILAEIEERRFRFRVTLEGAFYIFFMLAIGLSALNTGTQLLFLLFAIMCAFMILSAVMAASSISDLKIERELPREVTMLEPVTIRFHVKNVKQRWSSFSLRIVDFLEDLTTVGVAFVPNVEPGKTVTTEYRSVFPCRGHYRFRRIQVISRYPFGWIKRATSRPLVSELIVLPALIDLTENPIEAAVDAGDISSQKKGHGAGLYGIRKYIEGESVRDVHWKLTARTGNVMVREFESDEKRKASVLLDNRLEGANDHALDRFELAIVVTASLVNLLIERGYQVELVTASGTVGFDERPNQVRRCQRALASLNPEPRKANPPKPSEADSEVFQVVSTDREPLLEPKSTAIAANLYREVLSGLIQKSERNFDGEKITMESIHEREVKKNTKAA